MRIQIFSDLHVDVVGGFEPRLAQGVDLVICAGDACEGAAQAMAVLRRHIPLPTPIAMVLGNHEFYGRAVAEERQAASTAAAALGIALLDDRAITIAGVRLIGATLWTDFLLYGAAMQAASMRTAFDEMNDYRRIAPQKDPWTRFMPQMTIAMHQTSLAVIEEALATPFAGPTVVITHHAPHAGSIHARFAHAPINPAYVSDQSALIARYAPALWVHGHVHNSFDYLVGATRIVCNPRGYGDENPAFDPARVVEVEG